MGQGMRKEDRLYAVDGRGSGQRVEKDEEEGRRGESETRYGEGECVEEKEKWGEGIG